MWLWDMKMTSVNLALGTGMILVYVWLCWDFPDHPDLILLELLGL